MGFLVTPEKAILFTKLCVALSCSWPPSLLANKTRLLYFNVLWSVAFLSTIGLLLPLLCAIYEYHKEPMILGKTVSLFSAVAQVTIKMIVCRLQQKQFKILFYDMECFCKRTTTQERDILQRHIDKYKYYHATYALWGVLTAAVVVSGPLFMPQTFPTPAVYPFPVERQPLKSFIFFHQSLVGFQAFAGMAIDAQVALLLRYAAARFEILMVELNEAETNRELDACIRKHQKLLRYIRRLRRSVKFLALATVATTNVAVIFGSLNLVTKQPLPMKALYALVVFSASVELFMYAWPADNLIHMSKETATVAYNTNWYDKDVNMQKKISCMILRSQKLETIHISGILPNLSLSYYAKYLYTAFTYFTALRIMVETADVD
ncbi:uncharacterized protein LOC143376271 [Andrena cerasifolii]|uniref:uncharacterized protein LOC143376271 n=1 Tax=Andrena cerasifolii TaxID=2819439 RepID=UPI004037D9B6